MPNMRMADRIDNARGKSFENKRHPLRAFIFLLGVCGVMLILLHSIHPYWIVIIPNVALMYLTLLFILTFYEKEEDQRSPCVYPPISVVIPCYNAGGTIQRAVECLQKSRYPAQLEIIVVDDGSTDESTKKILAELARAIRVIYKEKNEGKAAALNTGIQNATHNFVACLDSDSYVEPDALREMMSVMQTDEKIGAVTAFIKVYEPRTFLLWLQEIEYYLAFGFNQLASARMDAIFVTPGPMTLFRKKVFEEVGLFDEQNITEDLEICWRMKKKGWSVQYARKAVVYTEVPSRWRALLKQRERWYRGKLFNIRKHRDMLFNPQYGFFGLVILPASLLSEITAFALIFSQTYVIGKAVIMSLLSSYVTMTAGLYDIHVVLPAGITSAVPMTGIVLIPFTIMILSAYVIGVQQSFTWRDVWIIPGLIFFVFGYGLFISYVYVVSALKEVYGSAYVW